MAIFLTVSFIFANSIYHLGKGTAGTANRFPASLMEVQSDAGPDSFVNFGCEVNADVTTSDPRLRLRGQLCGLSAKENLRRLVHAEIFNQANHARAIVYADSRAGNFESTSIDLSQGDNPIFVKFVYTGGKVVSQKLSVRRL